MHPQEFDEVPTGEDTSCFKCVKMRLKAPGIGKNCIFSIFHVLGEIALNCSCSLKDYSENIYKQFLLLPLQPIVMRRQSFPSVMNVLPVKYAMCVSTSILVHV